MLLVYNLLPLPFCLLLVSRTQHPYDELSNPYPTHESHFPRARVALIIIILKKCARGFARRNSKGAHYLILSLS